MEKVIVNKDACIGCGMCVSIAPDNFQFDDNGLSEVINDSSSSNEDVITAIESCPTRAISIQEENSKCQCDDACKCEDCDCDKN